MNIDPSLQIAVCGGNSCSDAASQKASEIGRALAEQGATLLCGGMGGVMHAAAEGARQAGGRTVGLLPHAPLPCGAEPPTTEGTSLRASSSLDVSIFTGMGQARNQLLVLSADAVIALGGEWGTLSEIALAMKQDIPVVLVDSWQVRDMTPPDFSPNCVPSLATTAEGAVAAALAAARTRRNRLAKA